MTSPYEMFKTKKLTSPDTPAILEYGDFEIYVKYGGAGNRSFINAFQMKMRQFERRTRLAEQGSLSDEAVTLLEKQKAKAMAELYADQIVVGWKGVKDENGKDLKYSRDAVIKLLTDLEALFGDIVDQCSKEESFKKEIEAAEEKNSLKS